MKKETNPNMEWGESFSMQAFMTIHGLSADSFKTVPYTNKDGESRLMLTYTSAKEADGILPICSDIELDANGTLVAADTKQPLSADNVRISKCISKEVIDPETGEVTQQASNAYLLHRYYPAKSGIKCSLF